MVYQHLSNVLYVYKFSSVVHFATTDSDLIVIRLLWKKTLNNFLLFQYC